jgi:hypothetical protein
MSSIGRFVSVGLLAISGAALCSCSAENKTDAGTGYFGGQTADTSGSQSTEASGGSSLATQGQGGAKSSGTSGSDSATTTSDVSGGKCGIVTQRSKNTRMPADIIIGIDTSGSMSEEVLMVQENLNAFSEQIIKADIDVHVILIADPQTGVLPYYTVDGPCIAAPLGSGNCPDDSKPPTFVHLNVQIDSFNMLDKFIEQYPQYKQYLRENSLKSFLSISDDNADTTTNAMAVAAGWPQPVIHTADAFIKAINELEPGPTPDVKWTMWSNWFYAGIYSFSICASSQFGAVGTVYAELIERTNGVGGDLCLQDFKPVFDRLATSVVGGSKIACEWAIPKSPNGEELNVDNTSVQFTVNGKKESPLPRALDKSVCKDHEAWYYDNPTAPTRVLACPAMCERVQAAREAEVIVLFDCAPPIVLK